MSSHYERRVLFTTICATTVLLLGCQGRTVPLPTAPTGVPETPTSPPASNAITVSTISPNIGAIHGGTTVLIVGDGFDPGAVVTLGGMKTTATVTSRTAVTAVTAPHAAAAVDVVVTNPGGQSGKLAGGYTYAVIADGPAPSITSVSPAVGTTGGGGTIRIAGNNFSAGAIVKLDDVQLSTYPFGATTTTLNAQSPAHRPGTVDVVVINPDGQRAILRGGYRYTAPGTLDFSGRWEGRADDRRDNHSSTKIALTIENNRVVSISCNSEIVMLSPPAVISDDVFRAVDGERVIVSGRFFSSIEVTGRVDISPCGPGWGASKQQ
jgi:hypothetical protein